MNQLALELFILLLLILLNGLFAMSEVAILTVRKARFQALMKKGSRGAPAALWLSAHPDQLLSTVQLGITAVGIINGVFSGAAFADPMAMVLSKTGMPEAFVLPLSYGVVISLITYVSIVVGELVPKRIALSRREKVALLIAPPLMFLAKLFSPFVFVLNRTSNTLLSRLPLPPAESQTLTEEEIPLLLEEGKKAGLIEPAERDIVLRTLSLGTRSVDSLMTPRRDIVWVDISEDLPSVSKKVAEARHTYYPVADGTIDTVNGMLCVKDYWKALSSGVPVKLKDLIHEPLYVPGSSSALKLLRVFQESGQHVALLIDEYGALDGLITVHDVAVAVLGDLPTSSGDEEDMIVVRDKTSWLVSGAAPIEDLTRELPIKIDDQEERGFQTLAGFILSHLGSIPTLAQSFDYQGLRFEVVDLDGNRVDKVLITKLPRPTAGSAA